MKYSIPVLFSIILVLVFTGCSGSEGGRAAPVSGDFSQSQQVVTPPPPPPTATFAPAPVSAGREHLGLWTGTFNGNTVSAGLIREYFFLEINSQIEVGQYEIDGSAGSITLGSGNASFQVTGDSMTINQGANTINLDRSDIPAAPGPLSGVWVGSGTWMMSFVNNIAYVVYGDGDADFGVYEFARNEGTLRTVNDSYYFVFQLMGSTLAIEITERFGRAATVERMDLYRVQ